ncbi:MAG: hypothetical protein NC299_12875 [Lachnospiraceae bacterium]|nr:hypothetical protein [Ruminococcus sp.]MCM1276231.1 hypothetical protein [Lachnospiraceae bacterium]
MINAEINEFIGKIMEKTQNNELNWQPAKDFFDTTDYGSSPAATELAIHSRSDWAILYDEDSFYLSNSLCQYLFLLHICYTSGKDGSVTEIWGMYAILDWNDNNFITIPDYHPADESDRFKKISELIVKNRKEEKIREEKRLIDFFKSFF